MIGWKQAYTLDRYNIVLVKLDIPDDTKVYQPRKKWQREAGHWCCDKARVLSITSLDGKRRVRDAVSMKDGNFLYRVGETVTLGKQDISYGLCPGIYFFKTKQQAIKYEF